MLDVVNPDILDALRRTADLAATKLIAGRLDVDGAVKWFMDEAGAQLSVFSQRNHGCQTRDP